MTKTRDLANLIADSKVGPTEIDTSGTYTLGGIAATGDLTLDAVGDIILDAAGSDLKFAVDGGVVLEIKKETGSVDFLLNTTNDDFKFKGSDDGSPITALTLDMSNAGAATFSGTVTSTGLIGNATNFDIMQNTSDGSDSKRTRIGGGGDVISSRGALVEVSGNEHGNGGMLALQAGHGGNNSQIRSYTAGQERTRLDASGTLLIGKTSSSFSTVGQEFRSGGVTILGRSGGEPLTLNRTSNDGGILNFNKDNTLVGTIQARGGDIVIGTGDTGIRFSDAENAIMPHHATDVIDNQIDIGFSSYRFKDLHLSGTANSYRMKVSTASSGASADVSADELVVESNGNAGISILTGQSYNGSIYFGDAGVNYDGFITYGQGTRSMGFGTAAGTRMTLDSSGRVGIGTASPDNPLEVVGADSGIKISAGSSNRPMLRFECGSDEKLILSSNTAYGAIGDGSDANRYIILKDGNVGIKNTDPQRLLHVSMGGSNIAGNGFDSAIFQNNDAVAIRLVDAGDAGSNGGNAGLGNDNGNLNVACAGAMTFATSLGANAALYQGSSTGGTERMRIDNSGNVLIAKNASSIAGVGHELQATGTAWHTKASGNPMALSRKTNDGNVLEVYRDSTLQGVIGAVGTDLCIGTSDTGLRFLDSSNAIIPIDTGTQNTRDDAISFGTASGRYDNIYATNGTINTSDRNEKQNIEELSDAERRVAVAAKSLLRKFKWKSAVASKGDKAQIHFGIIAQDLQTAFAAESLDAGDYGMITSDTWTDDDGNEKTRLGVRYSELLAFIISAI